MAGRGGRPNFDLSQFYSNLNRIESSLGKPNRVLSSVPKSAKQTQVFRKEGNKQLAKGKGVGGEGAFERVRAKLLSLGDSCNDDYSRITNTSNILKSQQSNKENLNTEQLSIEVIREPVEVPQQVAQNTVSQVNSQLIVQLSQRNRLYRQIQARMENKETGDLSLQLKEHLRQHQTMKKVLAKFQQLCGLENLTDLGQLYHFLRQKSPE